MQTCHFICGDDEFLVNRQGKELFAKLSQDCDDEFGEETIDGMAQTIDEVSNAIHQTIQATQTLSLFGGKKAVWLKGATFLSDKRPGNTEGAKAEVEKLTACIERLDPNAVALLITAWPVDRRRKEFKWFQKNTDFTDIKGDAQNLAPLIENECMEMGVGMDAHSMQVLIERVGGNTRLILEEVRKLATYVMDTHPPTIKESHVTELVPVFGEGDFFETTEAFFSLDLAWTLDALRRHFFVHSEARPVIASLQNRNRLLIQLRALMDAGAIRIGTRGISKQDFESAASIYGDYYDHLKDKSAFNIFTQNLWYLGNKVGPAANKLSMKKLIQIEEALVEAFEGILARPNEHEAVMTALAVKCLG